MFCLDIPVVLASIFGSAAMARRKGHSGILIGFLHAVLVGSAELTGAMAGLLVGFKRDPFLNKHTATMPLLVGGVIGLAVGIAFMLFVIRLLPDRSEERPIRRRRRPRYEPEVVDE